MAQNTTKINEGFYALLPGIADPAVQQALKTIFDNLQTINSQSQGPVTGTLSPDTKPKLLQNQKGVLFYATDFNRVFKWNGTTWEDAPAQDARNRSSYFDPQVNPGKGWVPADGNSALISTTDGGTRVFRTPLLPNMNAQKAWIRT